MGGGSTAVLSTGLSGLTPRRDVPRSDPGAIITGSDLTLDAALRIGALEIGSRVIDTRCGCSWRAIALCALQRRLSNSIPPINVTLGAKSGGVTAAAFKYTLEDLPREKKLRQPSGRAENSRGPQQKQIEREQLCATIREDNSRTSAGDQRPTDAGRPRCIPLWPVPREQCFDSLKHHRWLGEWEQR
ncbi:unnamed protein product [Leptosia nina]|uniref:Uncharacterized protein n=1 Tax=Leptosia nina TaxID=320188 RepID=A0AAV1IVM8_9NEOP